MRIAPNGVAVLALLAALVATGPQAVAQNKTSKFEVEWTAVANSCKTTGMSLKKSTIELTTGAKRTLTVSVPMVPVMKGHTKRGGKFNARAKRGKTAIAGLDGKFSIAGTIENGTVELFFIAEYYTGEAPLCTQSWKGAGTRK